MPGAVERVATAAGRRVAAGEVLCVVSAMKMEVKVTAPAPALVLSVSVASGARVVEGALLITLRLD